MGISNSRQDSNRRKVDGVYGDIRSRGIDQLCVLVWRERNVQLFYVPDAVVLNWSIRLRGFRYTLDVRWSSVLLLVALSKRCNSMAFGVVVLIQCVVLCEVQVELCSGPSMVLFV